MLSLLEQAYGWGHSVLQTQFLVLLFFDEIRLGISCELSAGQTVHIKCQVIFSLEKKKE